MSAIAEVTMAYSIRYDLDQDHFYQVCDERFLFIGELMSSNRPESVRASAPRTLR